MEFPEFITKTFFERIFQAHFKTKNLQILEHVCRWAVPPGDNFTSDLLRCGVTYELDKNGHKKTISVLVKISPETRQGVLYAVKEMQLFKKEIEMYSKILPEIDNLFDIPGTISAQCIYAEETPIQLLVLEDLSPLGYKMVDRREGLDLEHCLLVAKKVALLHAASVILHEKNPTIFSNYDEGMFCNHPFIVHWVNTAIDCIVKHLPEHPGMEKYLNKLENLKDSFFKKNEEGIRLKPGGFHVLNHGDCWSNNILFLYDANGKLVNLKMIDYQLGIYSGPGIDLQYFWSTTPNMFVRTEHFDTVMNCYYDHLRSALISLNYPIDKLPSKQYIYNDFCDKVHYGFAAAVTTLPLMKSSSREDATLEELLGPLEQYEGSFREHIFSNPLLWTYYDYVLPFFDKLGLFY